MASWIYNFRATDGYVSYTDEIPVTGDSYPTSAGGISHGWESGPGQTRDRSTSVDARLAGQNAAFDGNTNVFRVDLPSSGAYNIRLALGDAVFNTQVEVALLDDASTLWSLSQFVVGGSFADAAGDVYSAANWPAGNTAAQHTFSSSILRLSFAASGGDSKIAHLFVEEAGGGGGGLPIPVAMHSYRQRRAA